MKKAYRLSAAALFMALMLCACSAPEETEPESQTNFVAGSEQYRKETTLDYALNKDRAQAGDLNAQNEMEIIPDGSLYENKEIVENNGIQAKADQVFFFDNAKDAQIILPEDRIAYYQRFEYMDEAEDLISGAKFMTVEVTLTNPSAKPYTMTLMEMGVTFYDTATRESKGTSELIFADKTQPNDDPKKIYEYTFEGGQSETFRLSYLVVGERMAGLEDGSVSVALDVHNMGVRPVEQDKNKFDRLKYIELPVSKDEHEGGVASE